MEEKRRTFETFFERIYATDFDSGVFGEGFAGGEAEDCHGVSMGSGSWSKEEEMGIRVVFPAPLLPIRMVRDPGGSSTARFLRPTVPLGKV